MCLMTGYGGRLTKPKDHPSSGLGVRTLSEKPFEDRIGARKGDIELISGEPVSGKTLLMVTRLEPSQDLHPEIAFSSVLADASSLQVGSFVSFCPQQATALQGWGILPT